MCRSTSSSLLTEWSQKNLQNLQRIMQSASLRHLWRHGLKRKIAMQGAQGLRGCIMLPPTVYRRLLGLWVFKSRHGMQTMNDHGGVLSQEPPGVVIKRHDEAQQLLPSLCSSKSRFALIILICFAPCIHVTYIIVFACFCHDQV